MMTNDFFMQRVRKVFSILSNKYLIALIVFAFIMLFTDHNNIFEQMDRKHELSELRAKKAYYQQEIEKTKKELTDLSNNSAALEKYAREKFLMKRDNEDVFVVDSNTVSKK
jgi:cell division protein DivIC